MTNSYPEKTNPKLNKNPFWVTKLGGRIAVTILHLAALLTVMIEFIYPLNTDDHTTTREVILPNGQKIITSDVVGFVSEFPSERIEELNFTASYAIYGCVACGILVLLGKQLRKIVMRKEDYYEDLD